MPALTSGFLRFFQILRLMDPMSVAVILKLSQLLFQIAPVREKNPVQVFPPDGADELLGERLKQGGMGPLGPGLLLLLEA